MELNISLAPEILFNIGSFPVTNSLLWGFIINLALIIAIIVINKSIKLVPGGVQNVVELLFESGYDFVKNTIGDEKKAKRVFPLVFTMFIFVLVCNLITFIPGQVAFTLHREEGVVAVFRSVMADYGLVFLMTMIAVLTSQIVAIIVHGPFGYIGKFINLSGIKDFFVLLFKSKFKPAVLAQGFLDFFLGLMNIIGEVAKIFSLSFRLFGNMFAAEVLGAVMLFLAPFFIPLPFMFLGLLTAFVQAFVFAVLTLVFISMASEIDENPEVEKASI